MLVLPDSVESIGVFACYRNANLERVEGGKGIIKIYNGAFLNCQKLKYFELGDMVEEIGDSAFIINFKPGNPMPLGAGRKGSFFTKKMKNLLFFYSLLKNPAY